MFIKKYKFGFTLIEIVFALCLASIVIVSTYKFFWMGLRMYKRAERLSTCFLQTSLFFEKFKNDYSNVRKYSLLNSYPEKKIFQFQGMKISLLIAKDNELKHVCYVFVKEGGILKREEMGLKDFLNDCRKENFSQVILTDLRSDAFSMWYAFFDASINEFVWEDYWPFEDIPMHMKIIINNCYNQKSSGCLYEREFFTPLGFLPYKKKKDL